MYMYIYVCIYISIYIAKNAFFISLSLNGVIDTYFLGTATLA